MDDDHIQRVTTLFFSDEGKNSRSPIIVLVVHQNKLYIFGGYNNVMGDHFNDLHEFDPDRLLWRQVHPCGLPNPIPRRRQCCLVIEHQMFMFGGTSPIQTSNHFSNEIQEIDGLRTRLYDQSDLYILDFGSSFAAFVSPRLV